MARWRIKVFVLFIVEFNNMCIKLSLFKEILLKKYKISDFVPFSRSFPQKGII